MSDTPPPPAPGSLARPSAPSDRSDHRQQRDVHLHLLLAHRGGGAVRSGQHGLLHRRHRRERHRARRPLVHSRGDAVQLCRALDLHRKLLAVRSRRRVSRGQGGDGRVSRQTLGLGLDVRLCLDRPDQRHVGRPIHHGACARFAGHLQPPSGRQPRRRRDDSRRGAPWSSPA